MASYGEQHDDMSKPSPFACLAPSVATPAMRAAPDRPRQRRWVLAAAVSAATAVPAVAGTSPSPTTSRPMLDDTMLDADPPRLDSVPSSPATPAPRRPGDFSFLDGHWRIRHLKRRDDQWDRFDGEARC